MDKQHQPTKQKQRIVNRGTLFYVIICMLLLCDSFIDDVTCFSSSSLCKPPKFFEPFSLLQTTTNLFILTSHIERESERGSWELLLLLREVWHWQVPRAAFIEEREWSNTPTGPNPIPTPNLPHSPHPSNPFGLVFCMIIITDWSSPFTWTNPTTHLSIIIHLLRLPMLLQLPPIC